VSRRIRQVLSTSATAALLVTLANCADSPTASLTPSGPALSQGNSANAQADDDVVPGEILVGLKSDADAPGLARWQDRVNPVHRVIGCGCNCNRNTLERVQAAGFKVAPIANDRLHKAPPWVRPLIVGAART